MHAFRGRPPLLAGPRLDAELVDFHVPSLGAQLGRSEPVEQGMACAQDRGQGRVARNRVGDRFEPALDAAIERVVVAALIVRLTRLPGDPGRCGAKNPEPAAAVASAIGHVGVDTEMAPGRGKILPIGKAGFLQQQPHFRRAHESKAVAPYCVGDRSERVCHREFSRHKTASATTLSASGVAPTSNIVPIR